MKIVLTETELMNIGTSALGICKEAKINGLQTKITITEEDITECLESPVGIIEQSTIYSVEKSIDNQGNKLYTISYNEELVCDTISTMKDIIIPIFPIVQVFRKMIKSYVSDTKQKLKELKEKYSKLEK